MRRLAFLVLLLAAGAGLAAPLEVYFVRHGQTPWNRERRFQGSTAHVDLNEKGVAQAEETRDGLVGEGISFDRVYTSPLRRAAHTAEIVSRPFGRAPQPDARLAEMCFAKYQGTCYGEGRYVDDNFRNAFNDPARYVAPEGGETYDAFLARVRGFLEDEIRPLEGRCSRVLVVAHSGVLRATLVALGAVPLKEFWSVPQPNCCVNVLVCENGRFRVRERGRSFAKNPDAASASLAAPDAR